MRNKYIKVLGVQLKVDLDCDELNEYLIENDSLYKQITKVKELINKKILISLLYQKCATSKIWMITI